jgi:triosephosphate isomerase (TIM)
MKKLYIVANWKSNKTESEATSWLQELKIKDLRLTNKEIIICPSFTVLSALRSLISNHKSSIKLGAQDISSFEEGAYTGELNGKQIKDLAEFVIVGHSERRKNLLESEETINLKIKQAFKYGLVPIVCVSNLEQTKALPEIINKNSKCILAYEPLFAIGNGMADTPENADQTARKIKDVLGDIPVLYGGSVTSNNIDGFSKMSNIDGALIGKASLDAQEFYSIIQNA